MEIWNQFTRVGDTIFLQCMVSISSDLPRFCLDSGGVVTLLPAPVSLGLWHKARGQGSPQGAVKVKGLSLSEGSWSHHSDSTVRTTCPVEFFLPPLFLILPNGSGKTPDSSK